MEERCPVDSVSRPPAPCGAVTQDIDTCRVFLHTRPHQATLHPGRVADAAARVERQSTTREGPSGNSPLLLAESLSEHHCLAVVPPEALPLIRRVWTHDLQNVSDQHLETEAQRRLPKCPRSHSRTNWDLRL